MGKITGNINIQSPDIYIQGSGSAGREGIPAGIHLRWDLIGGKTGVLPKGGSDQVHIYRSGYTGRHKVITDLAVRPSEIDTSAVYVRQWRYANGVVMSFPDISRYDRARADGHEEGTRDFLTAYGGIMEISVEDKLMFSVSLIMGSTGTEGGICHMETVSYTRNADGSAVDSFISNRRTFDAMADCLLSEDGSFLTQENMDLLLLEGQLQTLRLTAENIGYVRFRAERCFPVCIEVETYEDYMTGINASGGWIEIASLGLSADDAEVRARLGTESAVEAWPHYIGSTVKVANYMDKWSGKGGLKEAVTDYVSTAYRPEDDIDNYGMPLHALIKLVAMDYHVARMLGLGHIDGTAAVGTEYIYAAQYGDDVYMTVPLTVDTEVAVDVPVQCGLTYGLKADNGTENPMLLTDANGYYKDNNARAVNLSVIQKQLYRPLEAFFYTETEFAFVHRALPVLYGIKYREASSSVWEELSVDPDYTDSSGYAEPAPVVGTTGVGTLYTHIEKNAGRHSYAVYGIDWFGRPTALSNVETTDETSFAVRNTLMPPLNFSVQIIQKEETLMLTTAKEQTLLEELSAAGSDTTLVRVTFDWNNINNSVYWYGKQVEFFFRSREIRQIRGKIASVSQLEGHRCRVTAEGYTLYSESPSREVIPAIGDDECTDFVGSIFSSDGIGYMVESVMSEGGLPVFTLMAVSRSNVFGNTEEGDGSIRTETYQFPRKGSYFFISENTASSGVWDSQLSAVAVIEKFSDHEETVETDDIMTSTGITARTVEKVGGVFEKAVMTEHLELTDDGANAFQGLYDIVFDGYILPANPNAALHGEWYKGTVRVKDNEGKIQTLDVWHIDTTGETLKLLVCDASYKERVEGFPLGISMDVNFHPGYRLYLTADAAAGFDASNTMPNGENDSRKTYLACRSADGELKSYISQAAVVYARRIYEVKAPRSVNGMGYAGRPDFYGKSAYTFDVEVDTTGGRMPYMFMFIRCLGKREEDGSWTADTATAVPLTPAPVLYKSMKDKNSMGKDCPAVKYSDGGKNYVRFTDYTLDGASDTVYFYGAEEVDNMMCIGPAVMYGPVRMIDTTPPPAPVVRRVTARSADSFTGDKARVCFEISSFPKGEGVVKILAFRTLDAHASRSVRTMIPVAEATAENMHELSDTFEGMEYPPYGETLFYRLVAVRTVKDENGKDMDVYSSPSVCIMANIEDTENPPLPDVVYNSTDKQLSWNPTCYKGTYRLYKMTSSGNWTLVETYEKASATMGYDVSGLARADESGDAVYHHFKVVPENTSGICGIGEQIVTITL